MALLLNEYKNGPPRLVFTGRYKIRELMWPRPEYGAGSWLMHGSVRTNWFGVEPEMELVYENPKIVAQSEQLMESPRRYTRTNGEGF